METMRKSILLNLRRTMREASRAARIAAAAYPMEVKIRFCSISFVDIGIKS